MKPIKITLAALLCAILFFGCNKEEDKVQNNFVVNGITDINASSSGSNFIRLIVEQVSGYQERVNLTSQDLPKGITIEYNPAGGIPDFNSNAVVTIDDSVETGTYSGKILAKSETITKVYEFKIKVPPFSFFSVDGLRQKTNTSLYTTGGGLNLTAIAKNGTETLTAIINVPVPEGVSSYPLDGSLLAPMNAIILNFRDATRSSYNLIDNAGKVATVNKKGNSVTIEIPEVVLTNNVNQSLRFAGFFIKY